jgi:putative hydrolase of the HAD superfamily
LKALVCDFGGVLTTPLEASFRFWSQESGVALEDLGRALQVRADREGDHPLHRLERGEITEHDFLAGIAAELDGDIDMHGFTKAYFGHLGVNDALLERLRAWKAGGLRMVMCTNNVREWEPRWRAMLPVDELFESVVDSAFVGARKPEPRIYEIVLERLGDVPAHECVFLDDFAVNCEAARDAGMHAVQFVSNEQALAELEPLLASARGA